jgi:hypothetical protein
MRIVYRISQFWNAITAHLSDKELHEISSVLMAEEIFLFRAMSVIDQRHCLDVYLTVKEKQDAAVSMDTSLVLRAALLHDVGKSCFKITILDRILITLSPVSFLFFFWKKEHLKSIRDKHASYSAKLVSDTSLKLLLERHHFPPSADDSPELSLLKEADSLN